MAEKNFWALNALAVQPGYAFWREALRHLVERSFEGRIGARLARMRARSCAAAGVLLFTAASAVARSVAGDALGWLGRRSMEPHLLAVRTVANAIVVISSFSRSPRLSGGSPRRPNTSRSTSKFFDDKSEGARIWRIAHVQHSVPSPSATLSHREWPRRTVRE